MLGFERMSCIPSNVCQSVCARARVYLCVCVCASAWPINLEAGFPHICNLLLYFIFFSSLWRFVPVSSCGPCSEQYVSSPAADVTSQHRCVGRDRQSCGRVGVVGRSLSKSLSFMVEQMQSWWILNCSTGKTENVFVRETVMAVVWICNLDFFCLT